MTFDTLKVGDRVRVRPDSRPARMLLRPDELAGAVIGLSAAGAIVRSDARGIVYRAAWDEFIILADEKATEG